MSLNRAETRKIELVETDNIARSLERLKERHGWNDAAIGRVLYHAILMANVTTRSAETAIREALQLP